MLSIKNVRKVYNSDIVALSDVSFQIKKGELVFLTGASGAGKSTLLKLLYYVEKPNSGQIKLGPFDLNNIKQKEIPFLRRHVGIVFQDFKLIPERTAAQNIALTLEVIGKSNRFIKEKVEEMLELFNLTERRDNYPYQLSGGEAQRVAMARAMINEPYLVLADEPTGNLDYDNARNLFELFEKLNIRGATILVATHQLNLAKEFGSRILHLNKGVLEDHNDK